MARPPYAVLGVAAIETLEGLVVAGLGAFVVTSAVTGTPGALGRALALAAFALAAGAGMVAVGIGLLRRQRWSRAPALVTQFLAVPVGISLIQSAHPALGVPLLAMAAGGLVLLLAQASPQPR